MYHSLGVDTSGQVWAWGDGGYGDLGQGNENDRATPVPVTLPRASVFDPPVTAVAVAASNGTSWAVGSNGLVYVWGQDPTGVDTCNFPCNLRPTVVPNLSGIVNVEAGTGPFATALGADGMVWRLYGSMEQSPVANGNLFATQIASGPLTSYAIGLDGRVYGWGGGAYSTLGDGTHGIAHYDDPVEVHLPAGVSAVAISTTHYNGYAIGDDGKLYSWGANSLGELGIGTTTGPQTVCSGPCSTTPVQVALPANYVPVGLPSQGWSPHTAYAMLQYVSPGSPATISGTPQSPAAVGAPYNFNFTLGGAPAPTAQVSAGSLPPGVTLSSNGALAGTPTTPGSYSFTVTAGNGAGPDASTAATIVVQPSISVGSASIVEGDSGTRVLKIPVTLSSASTTPVIVKYTLRGAPNGGTATGAKTAAAGIDFLDNGGVTKTLTFKPNRSGLTPVKRYISVKIVGDTIAEIDETFTVQLTNPSSGYVLAQSTATATILNND
jgi:hypothetical protein